MHYLQLLRIYIRQTHTSDSKLCLFANICIKELLRAAFAKKYCMTVCFWDFRHPCGINLHLREVKSEQLKVKSI